MEYITIGEINEYVSKSVNPSNTPDTTFEVYSVPSFDTDHPEYLLGSEIASNKQLVQKGDVLLCKINPRINRVWIVADETEYQSIASSEWIVIRSREYDPEFLAWYFQSPVFKKLMVSEVTGIGGSLTRAQPKRVAEYPVPKVDKDTQKQIVSTLNCVDKVVSTNNQRLAELDELVKARFVEMFGEPVANSRAWPKQQLGDNVTLLNGRAYQQDELLRSGKYPVLRVGNFFSNRDWYYSDLELEDNKYCYKGDLLYAWSASFGPRVWDGDKAIYHYHIWKVIINRGYDKIFLLKLLENMTTALKNETHGIAMMHLTKIGMEQTELIVPPIELQHQFSTFVMQVEKTKAAMQHSLDKAQLLFDSLMQKYFG